MSLEQNIITVTPKRKSVELHKQPFHMDGKTIVCNVCGENFTNLVLFGNHTHRTDPKLNNTPPQRSGPKTDHKTFNTMSEEEMMEAFHKMPELKGCWVKNGRYICNMCGKGCPNPYVLFGHKIIHPEGMTPLLSMLRVNETDLQQTLGVATQTKGFRNRKRNLRNAQDKILKKVLDIKCKNDDKDVEGDDDDDNVQEVLKAVRPRKKLKVMAAVKQKAKTQDSFLYKTLISVERRSTAVTSKPPSKQIAMEPGKKSEPATGGERMDLGVSSGSEDEEDYSNPITSGSDVDGDSIGNQPGRPNQKQETNNFKKNETNVYRSLIAVKGQSFVKPMNPPPYEYCINMFGHTFLDKCKLMKGRYYCDECPSLYSSPHLLLNHKLYHAKRKCLDKRRAAQEGTTDTQEEAQVDTTGKEDVVCFECNMCQVKFDSSDGLADHIEAHETGTQTGTRCSTPDSAISDVSKSSTSACNMEVTDHSIVVIVKEEPITDYEDEGNTKETQPESSGHSSSFTIKQEAESSSLPEHSTVNRLQTDEMDRLSEDKLFLKKMIFSPVVLLKRIEIEPNEVYIVK